MGTTFFYGIMLDEDEINPKRFLEEVEQCHPSIQDRSKEGFDEDYWYWSCFFENYEFRLLQKKWDEEGDPVLFSNKIPCCEVDNEEPAFFLAIKETFKRWKNYTQDPTKPRISTTVALPCSKTAEWDQFLRAACKKFKIKWRSPAFYLAQNHDYGPEFTAVFYYGIELEMEELDEYYRQLHVLLGKIKKYGDERDHEEAERILSETNSVNVVLIEPDPSDYRIEIFFEDYYYYFMCANGVSFAVTHDWTQFQIPEIDTSRWDALLQERCEKYGIEKRSGKFYLITWGS